MWKQSVSDSVNSYVEFTTLVATRAEFITFRESFRHTPLQRFVYHEKCVLGRVSEERVIIDPETGKEIGGIKHNTDVNIDEYYSGVFLPFNIKGIWLPLNKGRLYSILPNRFDCPLIRVGVDGDEILFLIHPKSERHYQSLMEIHRLSIVTLSALSLSSPRSLLVALPKPGGGFDPVMAKVTLDDYSHGILRILSERECALSVANTSLLKRKISSGGIQLSLVEDPLAFVPAGYQSGMLYRQMPSFLNPKTPNAEGLYSIPMLALYGPRNIDFLKKLVARNGDNVTRFLSDYILGPFAKIFMQLLTDHETSIEAHGQNLMILLDASDQIKGLMYRDMGGVNLPISSDDYTLPENLRRPSLAYFENHVTDASAALEHLFVWRGLYPLTKQLVQNVDYFQKNDPRFRAWVQNCLAMHQQGIPVLENWAVGDPALGLHRTRLSKFEFCRYGYVECLFGELLLNYLKENQRVSAEFLRDRWSHLTGPEKLPNDDIVAPCTFEPFFSQTIREYFKETQPAYEMSRAAYTIAPPTYI